jgi:hypothetical protein
VKIQEQSFKSIDGRINGEYLATPGGDAGEFILALQVYYELSYARHKGNFSLSQNEVTRILKEYLKYMKAPKFYMAHDDKSVAHLSK